MTKTFNVTGVCIPEKHYMADIKDKLDIVVEEYIEPGRYFVISRARQYGKTTMLHLLSRRLKGLYTVLDLSFEAADDLFFSKYTLASGLIRQISRELNRQNICQDMIKKWNCPISEQFPLEDFSDRITALCTQSDKKVILMIDEVDQNSDNQIFLSFLGLLRSKYLEQQKNKDTTFHSVILAGVHDIKNMKLKLRSKDERKYNSPWNIASDFLVDLSLSADEIRTMLNAYESDQRTGMDTGKIASLLYEYTGGYPFLVSRICLLMDERLNPAQINTDIWTKEGVLAAVHMLLQEKNTLFDSLMGKLHDYPELDIIIRQMLFQGQDIPYNADHTVTDIALTFGFAKVKDDTVVIANRIFETRLYNYYLTLPDAQSTNVYKAADAVRNQFFINGHLDMRLILEKFILFFHELYGTNTQRFLEEEGRRYFLLYLKPIINGTANYYIEAETRNRERTDLIIDCCGEQFVIELKIWHGNAYNERGEHQLLEYLSYYHLKKGYMLSFNFNKNKQPGVREITLGDSVIIEGIV